MADFSKFNANNTIYNIKDGHARENIVEISDYLNYDDTDIIGIEADFENCTVKRLSAGIGKQGGSDFNTFPTYGGIRKCNLADNGTVNAYYGDSGYNEDGSNGQVMVEIPKFYYRVVPLKLEKQTPEGETDTTRLGYHLLKAQYYISAVPKKDFKVHPAFVNGSGEVDKIYYSAYEGCAYDTSAGDYLYNDEQIVDFNNDKLSSIGSKGYNSGNYLQGAHPISGKTQNLTRVNAMKLAKNRGDGWYAQTIQAVSAIQLLFTVEYASFDWQSVIGNGVVSITDSSSYSCASLMGSTAPLGNSTGAAASTVDYTGTAQTANGKVSVCYRGIENFFGNIYKFTDGINYWGDGTMGGGQPFVCDDYNFIESKKDGNYEQVGFTLSNTSSEYVKYFGYSNENFDWLYLPSKTVSAVVSSLIKDKWSVTAGLSVFRASRLSGYWRSSGNAGGFCVDASVAVGGRSRYVSARSLYIPPTTTTSTYSKDTYARNTAEDNAATIASIKAWCGYDHSIADDPDIAGLQVDYENYTYTRLQGAIGKTAGTDFDVFPMYGNRKKCNLSDNGVVNAWYGDTGYTEDGSNGQVMVWQPKFYYMVQPLKTDPIDTGIGYHLRKANYYVCATKKQGFKLHPAFYDENGAEVDGIFLSAYEGCIYDVSASAYLVNDEQVADFTAGTGDKLSSIAGVRPCSGLTQNLTRANADQLCKNRGVGWHNENIKAVSAEQLLMMIELGGLNTQTLVGSGVTEITDNSSYNCASITGSTASLGNGTGMAPSTTDYAGNTQTTNGKVSICYRGRENFWGNINKFTSGINIWGDGTMGGGQAYICNDYAYAESKKTDNYEPVGFTLTNTLSGYISAFGYSLDYDWLFLASETDGTSALPVGDRFYVTAGLSAFRVSLLGGRWDSGGPAGGFCVAATIAVGSRLRNFSARSLYIPQTNS